MTVLSSWVKVPPFFVQLPAMVMALASVSRVPSVRVKSPLMSKVAFWVKVLPDEFKIR